MGMMLHRNLSERAQRENMTRLEDVMPKGAETRPEHGGETDRNLPYYPYQFAGDLVKAVFEVETSAAGNPVTANQANVHEADGATALAADISSPAATPKRRGRPKKTQPPEEA